MIFFILSGYWVTRMFQQKYAFVPSPVLSFYLSRFLRLWPAFACAILLALAARSLRGEPVALNQLSVLAMFGVASSARDPLQITWSLDIEAQFYLLLPLLLLCASRSRGVSMTAALVFGAAAAAWFLAYTAKINTAVSFLPLFAAGMAIQMADIRVGPRLAMASAAAFIVLGGALYLIPATAGAVHEVPMRPQMVRLISMVWALSAIPFVAWNVRLFDGRLDRHMGNLSYSLYLTHYPVLQTLPFIVGFSTEDRPLLACLIAVAVAVAFYVVVDCPFEALRRLLAVSPEPQPASANAKTGRESGPHPRVKASR